MSAGQDRNEAASENVMSNLMALNKLTYRTPPSLSVAKDRKYVSNFPQSRSYANGQTIVWNVNTGSQFLHGKSSYMKFEVKTPGATIGDWGTGSAANIFDSIRVKSRNGVEICRLQGANLWTHVHQRYSCPREAFGTLLQCQGYGAANSILGTDDGTGNQLSLGAQFTVPLSVIPCFDQDRLLPPQLMDGAIIEIDLNPPQTAIYTATASLASAPASYEVSDLEIRWNAFDLADSFDRKIQEIAARDGLSLVHKEYHRTLVSQNTSDYQYDVKKACSKALGVYVCPRLAADIVKADADSNQCMDQEFIRYQFQLGSTYHPNSPITNSVSGVAPSKATSSEAYFYTLSSWNKVSDCQNSQDVSLKNFVNEASGGEAKMGIASTSFLKSSVSDMAGQMVNSARALVVDIEAYDAKPRRLDTYLQFCRLVKCYVENATVAD